MEIEDAVPIFIDRINNLPIDVINLRNLYNWLQIGSKYSDWVIRRIKRYQFTENLDYIVVPTTTKGSAKKKYHATIDMAEKLCMIETSPLSIIARDYFRYKQKPKPIKITAKSIFELNKLTGVSVGECTKALVDCSGDIEAAVLLINNTILC